MQMENFDDPVLSCLAEVETCLHEIYASLDNISASAANPEDFIDSIIIKCERLLVVIVLLSEVDNLSDAVYDSIEEIIAFLDDAATVHVTALTQPGQSQGRPKLKICREQLKFLLDANFTQNDIASLMNCSSKTISRRIKEFNLTIQRTQITEDELDQVTLLYVKRYPNAGQKSYSAFLLDQRIHISRQKVRDSLLRVDPSGVMQRFKKAIKRRRYHVPGPNSVWHLDGYHKLIRWGIVIHGAVDGYSRLPLYLKASSNNKASTVLTWFLEAVREYGLPSRVRCDKGGENTMVSYFMLNHPARGPGRRSCITGRSVHNVRIERLWRDLYNGCICYFHELFGLLEQADCFDPNNSIDIFALHYTYLPWIQHQLDTFLKVWSQHKMRTAKHKSPFQLWIQGMLTTTDQEAAQGMNYTNLCHEVLDEMGIASSSDNTNTTRVDLEDPHVPINSEQLLLLNRTLDPCHYSVEECEDVYMAVRQFLKDS